jgi:hypothetical protein
MLNDGEVRRLRTAFFAVASAAAIFAAVICILSSTSSGNAAPVSGDFS